MVDNIDYRRGKNIMVLMVIAFMIIIIVPMIIIIVLMILIIVVAHHAVHGKRRTECPCRHPSRRGLLPEGQRRLQPEDGGGDDGDDVDGDGDDKSYNNKKMKTAMTVTTAEVVPKRYQKLQSVAA